MFAIRRFPAALRVLVLIGLLIVPLAALRAVPVAACVPAPTPRPGVATPTPPPTPSVAMAAAMADFVFRGHPIRATDASYKYTDTPGRITTFAVDTVWKGEVPPEASVITVSCGGSNPFTTPGSYIIYANRSASLGGNFVSVSDRTRLASPPDEEDAVLGPGMPPNAPGDTATAAATPTPTPVPCAVLPTTTVPVLVTATSG